MNKLSNKLMLLFGINFMSDISGSGKNPFGQISSMSEKTYLSEQENSSFIENQEANNTLNTFKFLIEVLEVCDTRDYGAYKDYISGLNSEEPILNLPTLTEKGFKSFKSLAVQLNYVLEVKQNHFVTFDVETEQTIKRAKEVTEQGLKKVTNLIKSTFSSFDSTEQFRLAHRALHHIKSSLIKSAINQGYTVPLSFITNLLQYIIKCKEILEKPENYQKIKNIEGITTDIRTYFDVVIKNLEIYFYSKEKNSNIKVKDIIDTIKHSFINSGKICSFLEEIMISTIHFNDVNAIITSPLSASLFGVEVLQENTTTNRLMSGPITDFEKDFLDEVSEYKRQDFKNVKALISYLTKMEINKEILSKLQKNSWLICSTFSKDVFPVVSTDKEGQVHIGFFSAPLIVIINRLADENIKMYLPSPLQNSAKMLANTFKNLMLSTEHDLISAFHVGSWKGTILMSAYPNFMESLMHQNSKKIVQILTETRNLFKSILNHTIQDSNFEELIRENLINIEELLVVNESYANFESTKSIIDITVRQNIKKDIEIVMRNKGSSRTVDVNEITENNSKIFQEFFVVQKLDNNLK